MNETYVFSDLQFGWKWGPITWLFFRMFGRSRFRSNAAALVEVFKILEQEQTGGKHLRIILNGDTLDHPRMRWEDLHEDEKQCINILRRMRANGAEVIVLNGNHDTDAKHLEKVLQLPVLGHEYNLKILQAQILVTHGDQFEHQSNNLVWVGDVAVFLFVLTDHVRWLFRLPPYKKHAREMREEALAFIKNTPYRAVLIGHNHFASLTEQDGKIFGNSGCVVQRYPLTFMRLDADNIALMEYNNGVGFSIIKKLPL